MAAFQRNSILFSLPLTPSSYNSHAPRLAHAGQSLRANNLHHTQNMSTHNRPNEVHKSYGHLKPFATNAVTHSTYQDDADRNLVATEGGEGTLAKDDEGSDDDLPSLSELFPTTRPPNISSQASKQECSLQNIVTPDLDAASMRIAQTTSGLDEGDTRGSQDRLVIVDEDEAEDTASSRNADTGHVEPGTSLHNVLATSGLTSGSATSISGPSFEKWWDVEEGYYVYEPVLGPGSCEQQVVPTAPAQGQLQGLRQSSEPSQDQTNQQDIGNTAQSTSVQSAPPLHSLLEPSGTGDGGWTEDSTAEPEEEMGLVMVEQVKSPPAAGAPSSSHPPRSKESQDEIRSRQSSETAGSRPEELRDGSLHATLDESLEWEQRETSGEAEIAEEREQQEVAAVEVASQAAKNDEGKGRDDGNSGRQQCGEKRRCQDKTRSSSQHFDTSDNEYDAPWEEAGDEDTRPAKRRAPRRESAKNTLIPSPTSSLQRPHSPTPSATQPGIMDEEFQADHAHLPSPIDGQNRHTPRTPQSRLHGDDGEREQRGEKRQHHNEAISGSIRHSESSGHGRDTDEDHEGDEEDENPRPTKKHRRLFLASPDLPQTPEIGGAQSQTDLAHSATPANTVHHDAPQSSPSPSDAEESAPVAEYHEWPFQGFLKRVTIGNRITYNLEFSLPHIPEHLNPSLHSEASSTSSRESSVEAAVSRKPGKGLTKNQESLLARMVREDKTWAVIAQRFPGHTLQSLKENFEEQEFGGISRRPRRQAGSVSEPLPVEELAVSGLTRTRFSTQEDNRLLSLKGEGLSWDEISAHFPERSKGTLQVRYSTKLKSRSENSKRKMKRRRQR